VSVVVVGAGVAGVACARALRAAGVPVRVWERARSVGGRMATRRLHDRPVDLGAAYFTVSDPEFAEQVDRWQAADLARPWTSELAVLGDGERGRAAGPLRWATPNGLRSLVEHLATELDVELERQVHHVGPGPEVDGEHADVVVLAMPDPQALRLLHPSSTAAAVLADRSWRGVITVAAGWPTRVWDELPAAFVNDHRTLSLIADDGRRRGDGAPVLVLHSTTEVAREYDSDPDGAVAPMLAALGELLGLRTPPEWTHVHRWRYASPVDSRAESFHLGADGIALAGDGWGKSKVETAWLSGTQLGRAVADRLALG
jgi:renalase